MAIIANIDGVEYNDYEIRNLGIDPKMKFHLIPDNKIIFLYSNCAPDRQIKLAGSLDNQVEIYSAVIEETNDNKDRVFNFAKQKTSASGADYFNGDDHISSGYSKVTALIINPSEELDVYFV